MLGEWENIFHINSEVRFGPIIDNNGINLFYDEDVEIKVIINNLRHMIESENDYRSIMIAGYAGVGKTTLVHYIKSIINHTRYNLFIINGEENITEHGIIQDINICFKNYYNELFYRVEKSNTDIEKNIKKILDNLRANIVYSDNLEKHKMYINTYNELCEDNKIFASGIIRKIRIVLDQIDLLDSNDMLKILQDNFTPIIHSKYITAIICARFETLESAKNSVNNFFGTNFTRHITMEYLPVEFVLKKRLEASSTSKSIPMKLIKEYFPDGFCDLISGIQNRNIRSMLGIFERLMNVIPPMNKGKEATRDYVNFLLENGDIDDLFRKINPTDTIPMIKIVFDAFQFQSVINDRFYQAILSITFIKAGRGIKGCSKTHIQHAISYLKTRALITDAFDIPDRYKLTPKGDTYKKLIISEAYLNKFCKTALDKLFKSNQFDETLFQ